MCVSRGFPVEMLACHLFDEDLVTRKNQQIVAIYTTSFPRRGKSDRVNAALGQLIPNLFGPLILSRSRELSADPSTRLEYTATRNNVNDVGKYEEQTTVGEKRKLRARTL